MRGSYTIGCPTYSWVENGLMLLGFVFALILVFFFYQWATEHIEFRRKIWRAQRDSDA